MRNTSTTIEKLLFFSPRQAKSYNMLGGMSITFLYIPPLYVYPDTNKSGKFQKKKKEKYQCWETILILVLVLRPLNVIPKK
jgi:phosphate starvation-inducible membrane PsiE